MKNKCLEKSLTVGFKRSWKCRQPYLIPPHGLLFSCWPIEKTDSLFLNGQMSFSDRRGLLFEQRGRRGAFQRWKVCDTTQNQLGQKEKKKKEKELLFLDSQRYRELFTTLHRCNVVGTFTMSNCTKASFMTERLQILSANTRIEKYVETVAFPNNYDELISFLKTAGVSDTVNRGAFLSYLDSVHYSIVPRKFLSSGSTNRTVEL